MTRTLVVLAAALALLSACGKKPAEIDAPTGSDPRLFPRTYPLPTPGRDPLLRDPPVQPGERPRS